MSSVVPPALRAYSMALPVADQLYSILQYQSSNNANCESVEWQSDTSGEADGVFAVTIHDRSLKRNV